jgi:hypothetical protein
MTPAFHEYENGIYSSKHMNWSSRKLLRNKKCIQHLSDAHLVFVIYSDVANTERVLTTAHTEEVAGNSLAWQCIERSSVT